MVLACRLGSHRGRPPIPSLPAATARIRARDVSRWHRLAEAAFLARAHRTNAYCARSPLAYLWREMCTTSPCARKTAAKSSSVASRGMLEMKSLRSLGRMTSVCLTMMGLLSCGRGAAAGRTEGEAGARKGGRGGWASKTAGWVGGQGGKRGRNRGGRRAGADGHELRPREVAVGTRWRRCGLASGCASGGQCLTGESCRLLLSASMAACASSALRYVTKAHPAEAGAGEQAVRPRGCKCTLTSDRGC